MLKITFQLIYTDRISTHTNLEVKIRFNILYKKIKTSLAQHS